MKNHKKTLHQTPGKNGNLKEYFRKALFDSLFIKGPGIVWIIDENQNLVYTNENFNQYFSLPEDIPRPDFSNKVSEELINIFHCYHLEVLDSGKRISTHASITTADGQEVTFSVELFPVETKMVGGYAIKLAPDSKRKELELDNQRLLNLVHVASNAIWEWDIKLGNIFGNKTLMEMIGYPGEPAHGLSWWLDHVHPDDFERVNSHIKEVIQRHEICWNDKYRFKCQDGNYKHISDRGLIIYENGSPVKMIGSIRDVTEVKELEHQLTEERLQKQNEISENVIQALEKERTSIGRELHDNINQILAVVRLYIGMLHPVTNNEKEIKTRSLEQITSAIDEISNLSKELVIPQLKKKGLIPSIKELIADINHSQSLKIEFRTAHGIYPICPGKEVTFFRIIQEQLRNILKHSQATEVTISLATSSDNVQLVVEDNGVGFDPAKKITGIGLSNIYKRTAFYKGTVNIETAEGKGCRFTVTIPIY